MSEFLLNVLLNILLCYSITCLGLMVFGTVGMLVKPYIIESIKTQFKYELGYELLKSTFQLFLFYYGFCWIWPYLLLDKDDDNE